MGLPCLGGSQPPSATTAPAWGDGEESDTPLASHPGLGHWAPNTHSLLQIWVEPGHGLPGHTGAPTSGGKETHADMLTGTHGHANRDTCADAYRVHTHSPRGLGGENPGHGGRILWPVSHPSELRLPRASPLTHVHVGARMGPSEGTQRAPSVETTAGTLCACMAVGEQAGARTWMCTHSVCVCVRVHTGQPGMHVHMRCATVQPL